jgi:predicted ATPase
VGEYRNDPERVDSEEFNSRVHTTIENVYAMAGYEVVRVPPLPVEERAQFILNYVKIHRW